LLPGARFTSDLAIMSELLAMACFKNA
jgi:hypothetical protein